MRSDNGTSEANIKKAQRVSSIHLFTRDLRTVDHPALPKEVIGIFIFNPKQIDLENTSINPYRSLNSISFMLECLADMPFISCYYGDPYNVLMQILNHLPDKANRKLTIMRDFTAFSIQREKSVAEACAANQVTFETIPDQLLTTDARPYKVFTPFHKYHLKGNTVPKPSNEKLTLYPGPKTPHSITIDEVRAKLFNKATPYNELWAEDTTLMAIRAGTLVACTPRMKGGQTAGNSILANMHKFSDYGKMRNMLTYETTHMSAYLKFGAISIRQAFHAPHITEDCQRELYWRDFYYRYALNNPRPHFGQACDDKIMDFKWGSNDKRTFKVVPQYTPSYRDGNSDKQGALITKTTPGYPILAYEPASGPSKEDWELFDQWRCGRTGWPIIDAAMRELLATGYMHNRTRMVTASFLCKSMLLPWQWGEMHFARTLIDYDPIQNNLGWLTVVGSGPFSLPWYRVFNPTLQQKDYDPDAQYIRKWVPELRQWAKAKEIHSIESHIEHRPDVFKARYKIE